MLHTSFGDVLFAILFFSSINSVTFLAVLFLFSMLLFSLVKRKKQPINKIIFDAVMIKNINCFSSIVFFARCLDSPVIKGTDPNPIDSHILYQTKDSSETALVTAIALASTAGIIPP